MSTLSFNYTQDELKKIAQDILDTSLRFGAHGAQLEINESIETSVDILNSEVDHLETSYDSEIVLSVFIGKRRGNVSVSQVPPKNLEYIIKQAIDIAKYTEEDPFSGLPEPDTLCKSITRDLELYNQVDITTNELINNAKELESLGTKDKAISSSDGANISLGQYNFILANSYGLNLGYQTTRYNKTISLIGHTQSNEMQTDYWYSSHRSFSDLMTNQELAQTAINRVKRRLKSGNISSGTYSVIFESNIAKGLISTFFAAISGKNIYHNLTFLGKSLGVKVFPQWLDILEDPFVVKGNSSCYFDSEGVLVSPRHLVKNGVVNGYILSSYSARQLGLKTTGNAGGTHNIFVSSNTSGNIESLSKKLINGLIIIETIGSGVNIVTGDYSVGASALVVENGEIQAFVNNITISGNLATIYTNIRYVSDDYQPGYMSCGSMLVDGINVSN